MPNCREPVTVAMVQRMCALYADQYEDSLESSLCEWNVLGIYYSFCLSEWAQNCSDRAMLLTSADGSPVAFTFNDIKFKGPNG